MATAGRRRPLTDVEQFVLGEVQAYWGNQNTPDEVFFTERDEAVLFALDRNGRMPVCVVLTNLGALYHDGTLSIEELREQIRGGGP